MNVKIITVAKQLLDTLVLPLISFRYWIFGSMDKSLALLRRSRNFSKAPLWKDDMLLWIREVFTATSFEEKNNVYCREATVLGEQALRKALEQTGWDPQSLDYIITVSCTGIMIPSRRVSHQ
jgi:predicted naringenin-chalcone synthase